MDFVEQLKSSIDIVGVVGEYVRLRKSSSQRYTGLCPFHSEKTPSFSVHAGRQFYYCFGCHAKGDAIGFVMEMEHVSFYEALKSLAERHGIPMPKRTQYADEESRLRDALFQMHEAALEHFRAQLAGPAGESARAYLARRGVAAETVEKFGLGYAAPSGRALIRVLEARGFGAEQLEASGLVRRREDGSFYDGFRNRLMFPIHGESGRPIAFGGRALSSEDNPKYLNSPETPIYKKSHVLYNLHRAKEAIRKQDRTILVEGYMDAIGVTAAGFGPVVASCGTALTLPQVQSLKRHSGNIVVNFDPDAPGAAAAERSVNLLLDEGMQVRIMELDGELDPDEYCKERGAAAYKERLEKAKGYFYWLADRARARHDVHTSEGVVAVLKFLLPAVQRVPDRLERMAIAHDLAGYIGVSAGAILESFRKSAADRQEKRIEQPKDMVRADEKGLVAVLLSDRAGRDEILEGIRGLEVLNRLATRRILQAVLAMEAGDVPITFDALSARLDDPDRNLLAEVMFADEVDSRDLTVDYGRQCLDSIRRSDGQIRRAQLKERVREAERAGNLAEALRLAEELQRIDRLREGAE